MAGLVPSLPPEAQRYIQALETRLEQAERSLRLLPQQRGPLPGWLKLGTIEASNIITSVLTAALLQGPQPPVGPFATFDLTGNTPGVSPLLRINDGTRDRFLAGNLAAFTDPGGVVSAAGYQERTIAADGTLVSDSVGNPNLIKIPVAIIDNAGGTIASGTSGEKTVKSGSFTLARKLPVFVIGLLNAYVSDSGGILALAANSYVKGDGSTAGPAGEVPIFINSGSGNPGSVTSFQAMVLAAGTYTPLLIWNALATTQTLHWQSASLVVIQLGS